MFTTIKKSYYQAGAAMTVGMLAGTSTTHAAAANNFSSIATNIAGSIESLARPYLGPCLSLRDFACCARDHEN